MPPPACVLQTRPPSLARSAYIQPSSEPTYTTPCAMAGDECTQPPAVKVQSVAPVVASNAYTLWSSREPT